MNLRTIAPEIKKLSQPVLIKPESIDLKNGASFYKFNSKGSNVLHVEWFFKSGILQQSIPLQATNTGKMLTEGTRSYNAEKISETFDFYGAQIHIETDYDLQSVSVSCIKNNFTHLLDLITEILTVPEFPQREFELLNNTNIERFKVNRKKVDFVAHQHLSYHLYGKQETLAKVLTEADYKALSIDHLKQFFQSKITGAFSHVIAAGDIDSEISSGIQTISNKLEHRKSIVTSAINITIPESIHLNVNVENAVQSGIRISYKGVDRGHTDFPALQVTNLILGGYFGSRLMSNIREDKGYTYGIGSSLSVFKNTGTISISTEVGKEVTRAALKEIHFEVQRMYTETVPEQELELAKNYLAGTFIRNSDGIFAMADRFKSIHNSGLDYSYYDYYFNVIENITAGEIKAIAEKYFAQPYIEVLAGDVQ